MPAALCPRLPLLCPGAVWKGSWEPSEAPQTRVWKRVGRGRGFPSNLRPAWLRESFSKFPAAPAQVASAGRADGGQRASLAAAASRALWATLSLASLLAGSRPGSRRAGPPPGAKAAADAGGSEGGNCPAPTAQAAPQGLHLGPRRAARGARPEVPEGAVRAGGPGRLSGLARPRATETFRSSPRPTPYPPPAWPKAPEGGGVCAGPPDVYASLRVPEPPAPSKFLPVLPHPIQREGRGVSMVDTPLMNINKRVCACQARWVEVASPGRGSQTGSPSPSPRAGRARVIVLPATGPRAGFGLFFFFLPSLPPL